MEARPLQRPRVSRETRLLFATVILSVVALWVLARVRFPERPPSVNPVEPVLTQLTPTPAYTDLASVVSDVQRRIQPSLVALRVAAGASGRSGQLLAALRIQDEVAVALIDPARGRWRDRTVEGATLLHADNATGLAAFKVPPARPTTVTEWAPGRLESPRYLLSTLAIPETVSLRPVFVPALRPDSCATWETTVWALPPDTDLSAGAFAFTTAGAFAGLVVSHNGGTAILPPSALTDAVARVLEQRRGEPGWLGLDVQPLTPALSAATGTTGGVIVSWVDPDGPAAGSIRVGDILEGADDMSSALTEERFRARAARLLVGDAITLHVRRGALAQPVRLTAIERRPAAAPLGLTTRRVPAGAEVVTVEPQSRADLAGVRAGDVITFVAGVDAPTPAQVARALNAKSDRPVLVGIARRGVHLLVPVDKP